MEEYLNKNIKEVLSRFPGVADILNGYNIGCVPCNVGTCRLKDIVEIHNLSPEDEQELFTLVAGVIYPGKEVVIPKIARKTAPAPGLFSFSPPIKKLVDEHNLIKRLLAAIPDVIANLNLETAEGRQVIVDAVDFIRSYADKYHHAKEEDILFKYFDENLDVLKAMHLDHESGRAHVRAILAGVTEHDKGAVAEHLLAYRDLLTEHIGKEDGILYPWMERNLSMKQIGELFTRFNEKENELGGLTGKYEAVIAGLEKEISLKGVAK